MLIGGIGAVASGTNSRPVGAGNNEEANRATAAETEIIRSFMRTPWLSYVKESLNNLTIVAHLDR